MADTPREVTEEEKAKFLAEAEKALAEARKARAEAKKLEAEAKTAEMARRTAEISLATVERVNKKTLASNEHHHVLDFSHPVGEGQVGNAMSQLDIWRRVDPGCDIEIRFNSPGGDVIAGMAFFDYIMQLRRDGHEVVCSAYGYAASMAGILLQAGTRRVMGREAYVLIHEIQTGVRGKIGEIDDEVEFMHKIGDRILTIFADRSKEAAANGTASQALTKTQFKRRWTRKDWWLTSEECLKYGIIDEVK